MNLLLIGPQGSGKGTQAELLVGKYDLNHIEAGRLIREAANKHTRKAEIIDHLANQKGTLLPDGVVLDLIQNELDKVGYKNLLFDGFPRTRKQYQSLKEILNTRGSKLDKAIYLEVSDDESIRRLSSRRHCSKCKKGYSLLLEPDRKTCDCGGELVSRTDDKPEAIGHRLEQFHNQTDPVLEALEEDGILVKVDGNKAIEKISHEIIDHVDSINQKSKVFDKKSPQLSESKLSSTYWLIAGLSALVVILVYLNFFVVSEDFQLTPEESSLTHPTPTLVQEPTPIPLPEFPISLEGEYVWQQVSLADQYLAEEALSIQRNDQELDILDVTGVERRTVFEAEQVNFREYLRELGEPIIQEGWLTELKLDDEVVIRPYILASDLGAVEGWLWTTDEDQLIILRVAIFLIDQGLIEIRQFLSEPVAIPNYE